MKHPLLSALLLAIAGMASSAHAQLAPEADSWGEPVDGVQLRLTLATSGRQTLPGELPALEVQIRNLGLTAVTVNPEALSYANVEIDDVWYGQVFASSASGRPVVIEPRTQGNLVRTYQSAPSMYAMNTTPARQFQLRPGPHLVRLRNLTGHFNVHAADGKLLVLVSNRLAIDIPELSATAERAALAAQASAGGNDGFPAAQRLVERYPDAALPAIIQALAATFEVAVRARYIQLAGTIPGDGVVPFLLKHIAPDVDISARIRAADALLAHGRDDGLWPLLETWEHVDRLLPQTSEKARLLEFLARTGKPQVIDLLGRLSGRSADARFALVQLFMPMPRNGSGRSILDRSGGASLSMSTFPGTPEVLPGGDAGAAAVEQMLGRALDDIESVPISGRYGDVTFTRPRVCDMAALVLSLRWPAKYLFNWTDDATERDRQIAVITAAWRKP